MPEAPSRMNLTFDDGGHYVAQIQNACLQEPATTESYRFHSDGASIGQESV